MRKLVLLAGIAILSINSANAQGTAQETTQIASWLQQRSDNVRQIKQLYDNYVMAQRTWEAVYGARDMSTMVSALGGPTRRFLPDAGDLVSGIGDGTRLVENGARVRSANQLFAMVPQASRSTEVGGRWLEEMSRRETTTANVQATADLAVNDIQDRISKLGAMQTRIALSEDIKDIETVKATIAVEQQNLALHNSSMQALQLKLAAADRTEQTRREQFEAQGAKRWADATQSAVDQLQGD